MNMSVSSVDLLVNPSRIEVMFKSVLKSKLYVSTVMSYIGYLKGPFLVEAVSRCGVKGRKYTGSPQKYYSEDVGPCSARLNSRQVEENHLVENIIYNELRLRGFSVDVGCVEKQARQDGKAIRKNFEIDFVANPGLRRCYPQSTWCVPDLEKEHQEKAPLMEVLDSLKKISLVHGIVKPTYDQHGILIMSVLDFLFNPNSLNQFPGLIPCRGKFLQ